MYQLPKSRIDLLLGFVLGVWGGGAKGYAQVRRPHGMLVVHLPTGASTRPSATGVRQFVLRPQHRASPYYLAAADTTALPLLEGPTYGLYYAGQGRTSHSASRYQIVYWLHDDLFWVAKPTDLPTQRKVLAQWFKAVGLRVADPERQRVKTKVESLVKQNQRQVDSGIF